MKLNEIKQLNESARFFTDREEIIDWLISVGILPQNHKDAPKMTAFGPTTKVKVDIRSNGIVNMHSVTVRDPRYSGFQSIDELRVQFGTVDYFNVGCQSLTNYDGFPRKVGGCTISGNPIKTLEGCPREMDYFNIASSDITSLVDISNYIDELGILYANFDRIKCGGLGLLTVKSLKSIIGDTGFGGSSRIELTPPFKIIEKYLGRPDDIFECQAELIAAGYEAYAQL